MILYNLANNNFSIKSTLNCFIKVIGWYTFWKPERHFAMDMAGFAVNLRLFKDYPTAKFHDSAGRGNLESDLLTQLNVQLSDLEPKADTCTKVC
jgi:galactosylgalactosylxylosylprotein 3-beta-glucuronosyltransferase 3